MLQHPTVCLNPATAIPFFVSHTSLLRLFSDFLLSKIRVIDKSNWEMHSGGDPGVSKWVLSDSVYGIVIGIFYVLYTVSQSHYAYNNTRISY
jgi:hypothetical protein